MRKIVAVLALALSTTGCAALRVCGGDVLVGAVWAGITVAEHSDQLVCALAAGSCQMNDDGSE